jgi:hypothetical protein
MKKGIISKLLAVSAVAMLVFVTPATTVLAGHHGGGYGGGHHGGYGRHYNGNSNNYTPPAQSAPSSTQQSYTPSSTTTSSPAITNTFDPTIFDIQEVLFVEGYYDGKVDGILGGQTEAALLQFQEDNSMKKSENTSVKLLTADLELLEALNLYTLL